MERRDTEHEARGSKDGFINAARTRLRSHWGGDRLDGWESPEETFPKPGSQRMCKYGVCFHGAVEGADRHYMNLERTEDEP